MEFKNSLLCEYIEKQNGSLNSFSMKLIENLLNDLEHAYGHTKNGVGDRLSNIVPNLDYDRTIALVHEWEQQQEYENYLNDFYDAAEKAKRNLSTEEVSLSDTEQAIFDLSEACDEIYSYLNGHTIDDYAAIDECLINVIGAFETLRDTGNTIDKKEIDECTENAMQMRANIQEKLYKSLGLSRNMVSTLITNGYEIENSQDLVCYVDQYGIDTLIKDANRNGNVVER